MALTVKGCIEEMQHLAKLKGGLCLSKGYVNSKTNLLWQCKYGHRWEATPFSVKVRESWCPMCANNQPLGMEEMHRMAKERKGKCLSKEYISVKTKLLWQCSRGHQFEATPDRIRKGRWCYECKLID